MKLLISFFILMAFEISMAQSTAFLPPVPPLEKEGTPTPSKETPATTTPATETTTTETKTETKTETTEKMTTQMRRSLSQYSVNAHLSALSTWVPMKYGISMGYIRDDNWTYEFEWTRASISAGLLGADLAEVKDERYGFQARWYPGKANSFNLIMGLFKSEFSAEYGNKVIGNMTSTPNVKVWSLESYGPQLGLSNRWQFQYGITFGVDWFVMYIPLFNKNSDDRALATVNNDEDRSNLEKVVSAVQNIPQFDLFKVTLGYTF